jgi:long-chain fatty acid transport protein
VAFVCAAALWSSPAAATGLSVARFGGEHGYPVTNNATAIYYNPAGIADSKGTHVFLDLTAAWRHVSYVHTPASSDVAEPPGATGANTDKANLFNIIPSPMIGLTTKLGDFALGAGFYTPFGGQAVWDQNSRFKNSKSYPGPVDGAQRWFVIDGEIRSSYYTLAAAYHVPGTGLSLGVSGNLVQSTINILRARNVNGDNNTLAEGRSWLDVSGWEGSFGAGVLFEAVPEKLWFGASYQSRPGVSGGMKLSGDLKNDLGGQVTTSPVNAHQDFPDVYQLGARWRARKDVELRLFGDYTRWSSFKDQCISQKDQPCSGTSLLLDIPRDWHDTLSVRAGGSFWVSPTAELLAGLGYYSTAVPDSTLDPSIPDWQAVSFTLGGRVRIVKSLHTELSYSQFFSPQRDNSSTSTLNPPKAPNAGGVYKQDLGVVNLNIDIAF